MEHIKAFWLQDEANGKVAQINGRTYIRSVHGIKDVEEEEPPKKKRKGATNSGGKQQNDAENQVSIVYFDEWNGVSPHLVKSLEPSSDSVFP